MYYNQSCAAKGERYGNRQRPLLIRSMQRAAVNIYKTESTYEMLVFAPGRIKEHFKLDVNGRELTISYTPPEGFPAPRGCCANTAVVVLCAPLRSMKPLMRRPLRPGMKMACCT